MTSNKLTPQIIEGLVKDHRYFQDGALTICVVTTVTGFKVVGKSCPIDSKDFDLALGQKYSYEDAVNQLWELEGYKRKGVGNE